MSVGSSKSADFTPDTGWAVGETTTNMAARTNRRHVDYRTIKTELVGSGAYYADPDFPPEARSLYFNGRIPASLGPVVWKRPKVRAIVLLSLSSFQWK